MAPEMVADRYSKSCQRTISWLFEWYTGKADDLIVSSFQVDAIQVEMQKDVRKDKVLTFYKIRKDEDLFFYKMGKDEVLSSWKIRKAHKFNLFFDS